MKKRLLFITFVIIFAFGIQSGFLTSTFAEGFMQGWNSFDEESPEPVMFLDVYFRPEVSGAMVSELTNEKTGEVIPANITSAMFEVEPNSLYEIFNVVQGFIIIAVVIAILVYFIKIIIAVNRSIVFDWANVKRIHSIGVGLLIIFVLDFASYIYGKMITDQLIAMEGYSVVGDHSFSFIYFILGMSAFLVAEVFAIGLKLREEQELTI